MDGSISNVIRLDPEQQGQAEGSVQRRGIEEF